MDTQKEILRLIILDPTMSQKNFAKELKISDAAISGAIKKLLKSNKIVKTFRDINGNHFKVNNSIKNDENKVNSSLNTILTTRIDNQAKPLSMRLHRHHRSYQLAASSGLAPLVSKEIRLNNNIQQLGKVLGVTIRLTTTHLIIEGIELYAPLRTIAPELANEADRIADALAIQAEQDNRFKLVKNAKGEVLGRTSILEIEINEHDMAKPIEEKGIIPLFWNEITGKVEVWTDKSKGLDNVESNVVAYIEKLREFTQDIVEDRWSVRQQLELNAHILATLSRQNQFFEKHNRLIEDVDKLVNSLRKERRQQRLF